MILLPFHPLLKLVEFLAANTNLEAEWLWRWHAVNNAALNAAQALGQVEEMVRDGRPAIANHSLYRTKNDYVAGRPYLTIAIAKGEVAQDLHNMVFDYHEAHGSEIHDRNRISNEKNVR